MSPALAPARAAEAPLLGALADASFDPRFGEGWSASQIAGALSIPDTFAHIARSDGQPVGFSLTRRLLDEAELMLVAVLPALRGRGLARTLLAAAMGEARQRGAGAMFLEVRANNDAAIGLYSAAGFSAVGRRPRYYRGSTGERFDAITLRRDLD